MAVSMSVTMYSIPLMQVGPYCAIATTDSVYVACAISYSLILINLPESSSAASTTWVCGFDKL